jgi:hypothetical protein
MMLKRYVRSDFLIERKIRLHGIMRTGIFSVRSAYKLALQQEQEGVRQEGSSTNPEGGRPLYNEIWAAKSTA